MSDEPSAFFLKIKQTLKFQVKKFETSFSHPVPRDITKDHNLYIYRRDNLKYPTGIVRSPGMSGIFKKCNTVLSGTAGLNLSCQGLTKYSRAVPLRLSPRVSSFMVIDDVTSV
jgi:hypothetical protein